MKMKNLWKMLAGLMVICLPFALAACGGDDDEPTGPFTYSYSWSLLNTNVSGTTAERQAAFAAERVINGMLADALELQFTDAFELQDCMADADAQTFDVVSLTESDPTKFDKKVKAAVAIVLATSELQYAAEALPENAAVQMKRGKTVVDEQPLR